MITKGESALTLDAVLSLGEIHEVLSYHLGVFNQIILQNLFISTTIVLFSAYYPCSDTQYVYCDFIAHSRFYDSFSHGNQIMMMICDVLTIL